MGLVDRDITLRAHVVKVLGGVNALSSRGGPGGGIYRRTTVGLLLPGEDPIDQKSYRVFSL